MPLRFMGRAPIGGVEKQVALTHLVEEAEEAARSRVLGQVSEDLLEEVLEHGSWWDEEDEPRRRQFEEALRKRRS